MDRPVTTEVMTREVPGRGHRYGAVVGHFGGAPLVQFPLGNEEFDDLSEAWDRHPTHLRQLGRYDAFPGADSAGKLLEPAQAIDLGHDARRVGGLLSLLGSYRGGRPTCT